MELIRPNDPEFAKLARQANVASAVEATATESMVNLRAMLQVMIDKVPGQVMRDVAQFHEKFSLPATADPNHTLPRDVTAFRLRFLLEELLEYADAVDFKLVCDSRTGDMRFVQNHGDTHINADKALDGLIDLVYVAVGTAYLHRFPFNEGWDRVQAANMEKVRAISADDPQSTRKHSSDVVKPVGWKPPVLSDLLDTVCAKCGGVQERDAAPCETCAGRGYVRRTE